MSRCPPKAHNPLSIIAADAVGQPPSAGLPRRGTRSSAAPGCAGSRPGAGRTWLCSTASAAPPRTGRSSRRALAERCRVLVPELPGHGGSSALPAAARAARSLRGPAWRRCSTGRPSSSATRSGAVVALRLAHPPPGAGPRARPRRPRRHRIGNETQPAGTEPRVAHPAREANLAAPARGRRELGAATARVRLRQRRRSRARSTRRGRGIPRRLRPSYRRSLEPSDALVRTDRTARPRSRPVPRAGRLHGARDVQVPLRDAFEYARRLRAPLRVDRAIADTC